MNVESWARVYARAVLLGEAMNRKEKEGGDEIGTRNAIEDNIP